MRKPAFILLLAVLVLALALAMTGCTRAPESEKETETSAQPQTVPTPGPSPSPTPVPTPSPEPAPSPTPEPQPEEFVISFVGDCTLASSQHHKGSARAFETVVGEDYAFPFAETAQYFENDYISIANMEGTFTTAEKSNGGTFTFKSGPEYANVFAEGSIEIVTLGNNHSMDYGEQGARDTKDALSAAWVQWADEDGSVNYQVKDGLIVGVYSKLYPTVEDVTQGIRVLEQTGTELIIVAAHWGIEGSYRPTADQEAVGRAAIDAGADIVYGSHPHVLQRIEEYGEGVILYSLGNWSFGGNTAPRDRDTAIIQITAVRDVDGSVSLGGMEIIPCELSSEQGYNNYQPHPYEPGSREYERVMSKLDGTFTGPDLVVDYSAFHNNGEENETGGEAEENAGGEQSEAPEQNETGEPVQEGDGGETDAEAGIEASGGTAQEDVPPPEAGPAAEPGRP